MSIHFLYIAALMAALAGTIVLSVPQFFLSRSLRWWPGLILPAVELGGTLAAFFFLSWEALPASLLLTALIPLLVHLVVYLCCRRSGRVRALREEAARKREMERMNIQDL